MDIRSITFAMAAYGPEAFPRDGRPEFAFAGRSNVGKSSLINALVRRRGLARVSQTPGKTQAVQFYLVNERFYLVDLPGYGYAKVSRATRDSWGPLVRSYLLDREPLRSVYMLVDSRRVPSELDCTMRDWLAESPAGWRVVLTKSDKLSRNELTRSRAEIAGTLGENDDRLIAFSSITRTGIDAIWGDIQGHMQKQNGRRLAAAE